MDRPRPPSPPVTPRHGHAPLALRHLAEEPASLFDLPPGTFWWERDAAGETRYLWLCHPSSSGPTQGTLVRLSVARAGPRPAPPTWAWDGDEERPTLTPSVHTLGHWHGWVRRGELVEA